MNAITHALAVVAILGSAMIGGVFFAFSSFVMKALARLPSSEGIVAMQSINVVVLNRSFLGVFMGTTVVSVLVAVLAITGWAMPSAPFFLAGALAYVAGTFLVTGLGNVPMNDQLAAVSASDPMAVAVWDQYLDRWTLLNTIRTVAAAAAALAQGASGYDDMLVIDDPQRAYYEQIKTAFGDEEVILLVVEGHLGELADPGVDAVHDLAGLDSLLEKRTTGDDTRQRFGVELDFFAAARDGLDVFDGELRAGDGDGHLILLVPARGAGASAPSKLGLIAPTHPAATGGPPRPARFAWSDYRLKSLDVNVRGYGLTPR